MAAFTTGLLLLPAISLGILRSLSSWLNHALGSAATTTGTGIAASTAGLSTAPVHRTQNQ